MRLIDAPRPLCAHDCTGVPVPVRVAGGGLPRAEVGLAAAPRLGLRGGPPYSRDPGVVIEV